MQVIQFKEQEFDFLFERFANLVKIAKAELSKNLKAGEDQNSLESFHRSINYHIQDLKDKIKKS